MTKIFSKHKINTPLQRKVFVGISGGVDSSVSLALLQKEGFDVTGVFLKVWHPDWLPCDWKEERRSAMRVCATLGLPFLTLDCEAEYKREVVDYMIREYAAGRTPNPDIFCNKYVKFGVFLNKALEMGADFVATGHYAQKVGETVPHQNSLTRIPSGGFASATARDLRKIAAAIYPYSARDTRRKNFDGEPPESTNFLFDSYELHESTDKNKDQSYFLYTLTQEQLQHVLFPIGHMRKPEVRKLAQDFGLPTATKKDSQGLCFIGKVDMKDFLSHYIETKPGNVLNTKGEIIGTHDGAFFHTIGSRHGYTITKKTSHEPRYFVIAKDIENNTITVSDKETHSEEVFSIQKIILHMIHFISGVEPEFPLTTSVRIRYRQEKQACTVEKKPDGYHISFAEPQNSIAVGQSAVLYDRNHCLGGGIIEKVV